MEERKQFLQLLAFSTGPALEVVQNWFECKVLNNGSLEQFLNDPGNKHHLFHEYVPEIACCECCKTISIAAPKKRGCLNRSQFNLMYDDSGAVVPGHEKKHGKLLQECLCKVSAKHSTEVTDFDIPIIHAIINICCPTVLNIRLIKDLKDVRNDLSHVGAGQIEKGNFNTYWSKLEQTTLGIAMEIGVTCVKMFKREISHLKTSSMEELKTLIESSKVDVDELLHHVPNGVKPILEIVGKMSEDIAMLKESQKNQSDLETHRHKELHTLIGETKEEIGKLKALLRIKEKHDRKETAAKNENQNVDFEMELESSALNERKTLQRLPELQEDKPKEEFQLVEGEEKCILLKMRADPHIFSSEEILRKAILSLIRKIIQANEIDTSEENTLNVSLTFMSPLTNEQKRIVCSMISRNEFLNKQEFTDAEESRTDYTVKAETSVLIEKPEADKEELQTDLIKKQEADQEELQTDVRKKPGAVKEELQTDVINLSSETDDKIKFRLKIMGFPQMEETEHSALVNTGDEIWDVAWNWSLSSHYKVDKIVSILKDNLSAFKNYWFEIDVVKNNIFDQLILHTTTQRQAFASSSAFDAAVNSFINKLVELCALKDETEGKQQEIEIRIAIRSSLTKYTDKTVTGGTSLSTDFTDNKLVCENCHSCLVCGNCKMKDTQIAELRKAISQNTEKYISLTDKQTDTADLITDPQKMPYSPDEIRYAKSAMVTERVFQKMMQEIAAKKINPSDAHNRISQDEFSMFRRMPEAKNIISSMVYDGYNQLNVPILYCLLRDLNLVDHPEEGWGKFPSSNLYTRIGDDIERMRKLRDDIVHTYPKRLNEDKFSQFVEEVLNVARRIDPFLRKNQTDGFTAEIEKIQEESMDQYTAEKYTKLIEEKTQWREQDHGKNVKIYYGVDVESAIGGQTDVKTDRWLKVYLTNVKDIPTALERIKQMKKALKDKIRIEEVTGGSIVLHIRVPTSNFSLKSTFNATIISFLKEVIDRISDLTEGTITALISIDEIKEISLFAEAQQWRHIRSKTLPNLQNIEDQLGDAANRISTARASRNALFVVGLLGAIAAPLTGGASLSASATAFGLSAGGLAIGVLLFERYIEKDAMKRAQSSIDRDKAETVWLRHRLTYYKIGGTMTERQLARLLESHFPEAILLNIDHSLEDFIKSFVNTEVGSVFAAKERLRDFRQRLEQELKKVEEVESVFY